MDTITITCSKVASTEPDIDEVNPIGVDYREGAAASLGACAPIPMGVAELDPLPDFS